MHQQRRVPQTLGAKWAEEKAAAGGNPQKYVDIAAAGKAKKVVEKEQADEEKRIGVGGISKPLFVVSLTHLLLEPGPGLGNMIQDEHCNLNPFRAGIINVYWNRATSSLMLS